MWGDQRAFSYNKLGVSSVFSRRHSWSLFSQNWTSNEISKKPTLTTHFEHMRVCGYESIRHTWNSLSISLQGDSWRPKMASESTGITWLSAFSFYHGKHLVNTSRVTSDLWFECYVSQRHVNALRAQHRCRIGLLFFGARYSSRSRSHEIGDDKLKPKYTEKQFTQFAAARRKPHRLTFNWLCNEIGIRIRG